MTTEPAVRIAGVHKSYGSLEVLRGVDLDVERGSILALLGSNGGGKTTLARPRLAGQSISKLAAPASTQRPEGLGLRRLRRGHLQRSYGSCHGAVC